MTLTNDDATHLMGASCLGCLPDTKLAITGPPIWKRSTQSNVAPTTRDSFVDASRARETGVNVTGRQ